MYTHFSISGKLTYEQGIVFAKEMTDLMKKYELTGEFRINDEVE